MQHDNGLRHIVLCAFSDDMSEQQGDFLVRAFAALKDVISEIRHFEHGLNTSAEGLNDGYTHCFTLTFETACGRDAYLVAEAHLRFVEQLKPWLAKVLVFDYQPS